MTVVEQARRMGSRVIYAASSSCYGVNPPLPTREDAPIACAHPYALTKRMGEELVLHYGQVYGLPVVSLRLFNVYGPRARTSGAYGAVIGTFLAQKANGAPLTIVGDGKQRRDFVHVDDVVEAFMRAATSEQRGVFNIGSGRPSTVNALARMIGGPAVYVPARGGEPMTTWADIFRAEAHLGWRPSLRLLDGLDRLKQDLTPWKNAPVWTPEAIEKATAAWATHLG
jgi:UDP-glucose 4-epimerase